MSASTKLSTAVKALCYLDKTNPIPQTSKEIAKNTGINSSKLRQILSMLVKKDIVQSIQGTNGGFLIKKSPAKLHLQEIYCAVEDRKAFYLDVTKTKDGNLNDSLKLNNYFLDLFADVQVDIENKMRKIKLNSIIKKINSY